MTVTLPTFPASAAAFLDGLNSDIYDPDTNPKGFGEGGHITLFPEATEAVSELADYFSSLGDALQTLAAQVAADAQVAEDGSGTEASAADIRAGAAAFYMSIRRAYAAGQPIALVDGPVIPWDMSQSINPKLTLGAAGRTVANPTNKILYKSGLLRVFIGVAGANIADNGWGSDYIWIGGKPVWPTTVGARSTISYFVNEDGKIEMSFGGSA